MVDKVFDTPALDNLLEGEAIIAENVSYDEFLRIFNGRRAEWLMGSVIEHMTNVPKHQLILGVLYSLFNFFLSLKTPGQVLLAGVSMYLGDDKPAREPDLIVVLAENAHKITDKNLNGIGDIVVEIVSEDSQKRDHVIKLHEYAAAGIPEYWLIDPLIPDAKVYVLQNGKYGVHPTDDKGRLQSIILPGFAVHPELFWQNETPNAMALLQLVQQMLNPGEGA